MKLSVVVFSYNHDQFIDQALTSILSQEVDFEYEIVIGDDASKDQTRTIITQYKKQYPSLIRPIFYEKNKGPKNNFTQTIEQARGDYIALLDGDDYWTDPHKLQQQIQFLDTHRACSFCFHAVKRIYDSGKSDYFIPFSKKQNYTLQDLLHNFTFIHSSSIMFRRGLFGSFPAWFYSDSIKLGDLTLHILNAQYGAIGYIDKVMAIYRIHSNSIFSQKSRVKQILWDVQTRNSIHQHLFLNPEAPSNRERFNRNLQKAISSYEQGKIQKAKRALLRCVITPPFIRSFSSRYLFTIFIHFYAPWLFPLLVTIKGALMRQFNLRLPV